MRGVAASCVFWILPLAVIGLVYFSPKHILSAGTALSVLVGLGVLILAARRPDRSLLILIALLPFQGLLLAKLWALGLPTSLVRHLGAWKELLALGVILAGVRNFLATGRRADTLDRLALAYVAIAAIYLVAQHILVPGSPSSSNIRLLGFRQDAGFVLVLLGARHAPFPPGFLRRAGNVVLFVGIVIAGTAVFEAIDSGAWNRFVIRTIQYTRYEIAVLHGQPLNPNDIRIYGTIGGVKVVRVGSVFLSALTLGFYLLLPFAVGIERVARGQAKHWVLLSLPLIGAAILLTQTRSAALATFVVLLIAFVPAAGRSSRRRIQLGIVIGALIVLAVPTAFATGLAERVSGNGQAADNANHVAGFSEGVSTIEHHPLGLGLGTSAGTGQRFQSQVSQVVVPENNYLQFGIEMGLPALLLFVSVTAALLIAIKRAARRHPHALLAAAGAAVAGVSVGAWFLQLWTDFPTAWSIWGLAGAGLSVARHDLAGRTASADYLELRAPAAGGRAVAHVQPVGAGFQALVPENR